MYFYALWNLSAQCFLCLKYMSQYVSSWICPRMSRKMNQVILPVTTLRFSTFPIWTLFSFAPKTMLIYEPCRHPFNRTSSFICPFCRWGWSPTATLTQLLIHLLSLSLSSKTSPLPKSTTSPLKETPKRCSILPSRPLISFSFE